MELQQATHTSPAAFGAIAAQASEPARQFITCTLGEAEYGIDIMAVREIKGWIETTSLPHAPPWIRGVINLRGIIVPILDLRARFDQGSTTPTPMHVVVIIQTGFSTNLAALLNSPEDLALIRDKVSLVVAMAGNFADGAAEYNVKIDATSAKAVFEHWPTPIVFSGFEIGRELLYPAGSIERDFSWASPHPIAESYRAYKKMPYDRPTWDLTAALEAVRPGRGYFGRSENGTVTVDPNGVTHFAPGPGDRQYLRLDPAKRPEILSVLELLSSETPAGK